MQIVLCPGIHSPSLTVEFWEILHRQAREQGIEEQYLSPLIFPDASHLAFSAIHVNQWLTANHCEQSLVIIAFSAGVVGAIGAAWLQQLQGKAIQAFIAIDGWGMPLGGTFPIYRLSHDRFSYDSSYWLGGEPTFYADPPVSHLEMWQRPDRVVGRWQQSAGWRTGRLTDLICQILLQVCIRR
jgi:hypothetical protein